MKTCSGMQLYFVWTSSTFTRNSNCNPRDQNFCVCFPSSISNSLRFISFHNNVPHDTFNNAISASNANNLDGVSNSESFDTLPVLQPQPKRPIQFSSSNAASLDTVPRPRRIERISDGYSTTPSVDATEITNKEYALNISLKIADAFLSSLSPSNSRSESASASLSVPESTPVLQPAHVISSPTFASSLLSSSSSSESESASKSAASLHTNSSTPGTSADNNEYLEYDTALQPEYYDTETPSEQKRLIRTIKRLVAQRDFDRVFYFLQTNPNSKLHVWTTAIHALAGITLNHGSESRGIKIGGQYSIGEICLKMLCEMKRRNLVPTTVSYNGCMKAFIGEAKFKQALKVMKLMIYSGAAVNVMSVNYCISAHAGLRNWKKVLRFGQYLMSRELQITSLTCNALLLACNYLKKNKFAKQTLEYIFAHGTFNRTLQYNSAIAICVPFGNVEIATLLFEQMEKDKLAKDHITYNSYIEVLRNAGQHKQIVELVNGVETESKLKGVPKNIKYDPSLGAFARRRKSEVADKGEEEKQYVNGKEEEDEEVDERDDGLVHHNPDTLDTYSYSVLMDKYAKEGKWLDALQLLENMKEKGIKAHQITYNSCMNACAKAGLYDNVLKLFREMPKENIEPDSVSYNIVIGALSTAGKIELALKVMEHMRSQGITPNLINYNNCIRACQRTGKYMIALNLLNNMESEGLEPNVISYTGCITAMARGRKWQFALDLLDRMKKNGVTPNERTYNSCISACESCGRWIEALDLVKEMLKENVPLSVITFSTCIRALSKARLFDKAIELYEKMKQQNIEPDMICYCILIDSCDENNRWMEAQQIMTEMQNDSRIERIPLVAYNHCLSALAKGQQVEACFAMLEQLKRAGDIEADINSYASCIKVCVDGKDLKRAKETIREAQSLGLGYSPYFCQTCIQVCVLDGDWQGVLDIFELMKREGYVMSRRDWQARNLAETKVEAHRFLRNLEGK